MAVVYVAMVPALSLTIRAGVGVRQLMPWQARGATGADLEKDTYLNSRQGCC